MAALTIAVAHPETIAHDIAGNAARHADAIRAAASRVVVFPEMSLTGYEFGAEPLHPSDERLAPLAAACAEIGSVALPGAPVRTGRNGISIATLVIEADTVAVGYRKMWLGDAESRHYLAGTQPTVLEVDGWRLGIGICKDTGVPEHAATTAARGIDIYVAGVLEHAADRDVQPTRARRIAREHGVWVALASYAGCAGEGFDRAAGESGIWRPDATVAARAGRQPGQIAAATVERSP